MDDELKKKIEMNKVKLRFREEAAKVQPFQMKTNARFIQYESEEAKRIEGILETLPFGMAQELEVFKFQEFVDGTWEVSDLGYLQGQIKSVLKSKNITQECQVILGWGYGSFPYLEVELSDLLRSFSEFMNISPFEDPMFFSLERRFIFQIYHEDVWHFGIW
jgi:hypothetical protein